MFKKSALRKCKSKQGGIIWHPFKDNCPHPLFPPLKKKKEAGKCSLAWPMYSRLGLLAHGPDWEVMETCTLL
jgi:hypothetical protein